MTDQDLSPEEQDAFANLPRHKHPGPLLEDRTVKSLHRRGLLNQPEAQGLVLSRSWQSMAAVIVVVLLCGSYLAGQWTGSRQTAQQMLAMRNQNSEQLTETLQQTSVAYLAALSELVNRSAQEPRPAQAQVREVAVNSLYDLADQMTRLAPDDPMVSGILQSLSQEALAAQPDSTIAPQQKIVWF